MAKCPIAEAFGTFDWINEPAVDPSTVRDRAINELERRIPTGQIPAIGDRPPLEDDLFPDDFREEWWGPKSKGPSIPEMQRLRAEWGEQIDDRINQRNAYAPPEQVAETLWQEFQAAYPHHVTNPAKVQQIARQVADEGGLNWDDRADFYARVARKLDSNA